MKFINIMTRAQFQTFANALPTLGKRVNKAGKTVSVKRKVNQCAFSVVASNAGAHTIYIGLPKGATFALFKAEVTGGETIDADTFGILRKIWNDIEAFAEKLETGWHAGTFNLTINAAEIASLGFRAGNAPVSKSIRETLAAMAEV
jgi:hypothetical protein